MISYHNTVQQDGNRYLVYPGYRGSKHWTFDDVCRHYNINPEICDNAAHHQNPGSYSAKNKLYPPGRGDFRLCDVPPPESQEDQAEQTKSDGRWGPDHNG